MYTTWKDDIHIQRSENTRTTEVSFIISNSLRQFNTYYCLCWMVDIDTNIDIDKLRFLLRNFPDILLRKHLSDIFSGKIFSLSK